MLKIPNYNYFKSMRKGQLIMVLGASNEKASTLKLYTST